MKKILYIICSFIVLGCYSCSDFLEEQPLASTSTAQSFSNVTYATKSVLGVYRAMAGGSGYGSRLSLIYPYDNDEMWSVPKNLVPDNGSRDIARYDVKPQHSYLEPVFRNLYTGIERANLCIKYIPQMADYTNGTEEVKKQLRRLYGESLCLRALFYFELIRNWGDVPAQFIPSEDMTDLNIPKTDRDEIYGRILEDLCVAADLLPWRNEPGIVADERITQGAARALRARIALFRGGYSLRRESGKMERKADYKDFYQIAKDECEEILKHTAAHDLNPSYQAVFKDAICAYEIEPHGEVMFEVAMIGNSYDMSSSFGYTNGPKVAGNGNQAIIPLPTYFYAFDPQDTRREVTIANYRIDNSGNKELMQLVDMADGKFRRDWIATSFPLTTKFQYTDINWPIIRFSDVLLMFAEADNEINGYPTDEAIAAYKRVRMRAFANEESLIGTIPTTYDAFFDAIVNERSLEFGGEGIRKYDLIRWNLMSEKFEEARRNLQKMKNQEFPYDQLPRSMYYKKGSELLIGNSYYEPTPTTTPAGYTKGGWINGISDKHIGWIAPNFIPNHSELLPVPQTAIEANKNITQDYGY